MQPPNHASDFRASHSGLPKDECLNNLTGMKKFLNEEPTLKDASASQNRGAKFRVATNPAETQFKIDTDPVSATQSPANKDGL